MSSVRIACIGDVMCGESFYCMGDGVAASLDRYGRDFLDGHLIEYIQSHDLAICNVECAISDVGGNERSLRRSQMRAKPEAANLLAGWGIKIANVANNHIMEHGRAAAVDTVMNLEKAGIRTVGAGKDRSLGDGLQVVHAECGGLGVAFIGVCFRKETYAYGGGATFGEILDAVRQMRKQGRPVVISAHWGDELMDRPSVSQRKMAHALAAAGASVIAGHHPHVVQGFERAGNCLIAYSLGNFIFSGIHPQTHWSVILSVTVSGDGVSDWTFRLIRKDADHRPHAVTGREAKTLEREVARRCQFLSGESRYDEYERNYKSDLKSQSASASRDLRAGVLKRIHRMRPLYLPQVLWRPVQRRLGIW
jgi:gamma-polyglutamate biosynthesis protein CapA